MPLHAAVIGSPVAHSLSPDLHAAAYAYLGLPIDYGRQDLVPEALAPFIAGLGRDWTGLSVTMPHKHAVVQHAHQASERVELLGAANTWVRDHPDHPGQDWVHNTDVDGIVGALRFAGVPQLASVDAVGVLGNGGTASAAVLAASLLGAGHVLLFVRNAERAAPVAALAERIGLQAAVEPLAAVATAAPSLAATVATLPPGGADSLAASLAGSVSGQALPPLLDAAYDPWPSALAAAWRSCGGQIVSGMEMLLYQAVEQVRLFSARARAEAGTPEPDWAAVTGVMAAAISLPAR